MNSIQRISLSCAVALSSLTAFTGCAAKPKAAKPGPQAALVAPAPTRPPVARTGSLYDRLGGDAAIRKVVDDFVARASADPAVNFTRKGHATTWEPTSQNVERLKERLVQFIATNAGGPSKHQYHGRDMVTAHRGMGVSDAEFDALAGHLAAALEANDVPRREREELMDAVASTRCAIVESTDTPSTGTPIASTPVEPAPAEPTTDGQATVPQDDAETPEAAAPADEVYDEPAAAPEETEPQDDAPAAEDMPAESAPEERESAEASEYDADGPR